MGIEILEAKKRIRGRVETGKNKYMVGGGKFSQY
jgi:hypothetical protein